MSVHVSAERSGGVLTIRFTNPARRNAMSAAFRAELARALHVASTDERVKAVYITGSGAAFCAGGDLQVLKAGCEPWTVYRRFRDMEKWLLPLFGLDKPVVVGVNGYAVGGGIGLALSGDIIVAAESAKFVPGFFRLGVVPDVGTMYSLPRLIGLARAKQFLFSGETWTAQHALNMGLVCKVVADEQLDDECMRRASALAAGPANIMGLAKRIMSNTFETGLAEMSMLEGLGQALSMSSAEFRDRLNAMLETTKAAPANRKAARRTGAGARKTSRKTGERK